jgi:uncharacterized OB-fold protein
MMNDLEWYCDNCGSNYISVSGICMNCFSLIKQVILKYIYIS